MSDRQSPEPSSTELADRISQDISDVHPSSYGVPVHAARTHLLDDMVVTVLDVGLSKLEETLIEHGSSAPVRDVRREFQEAIGATFVATVEHHTGRRVIGFISETHLNPSFSVEVFRLAPQSSAA